MTSLLTAEELRGITAREQKATPGPWTISGTAKRVVSLSLGYFWSAAHIPFGTAPQQESDADFIAHARSDIPALLAHIKELTRCQEEAAQNAEGSEDEATRWSVKYAMACEQTKELTRERDEEREAKYRHAQNLLKRYDEAVVATKRAESAEAQVKELTKALEEKVSVTAQMLKALRIVQKGLREGHIPDQTLISGRSAANKPRKLTPLSEIIGEAIEAANGP